jgi:hypothetical protein
MDFEAACAWCRDRGATFEITPDPAWGRILSVSADGHSVREPLPTGVDPRTFERLFVRLIHQLQADTAEITASGTFEAAELATGVRGRAVTG